MGWFNLVIMALGVTRLTILITRDDITAPFRDLIWKHSSPDTGVLGGIVDCPDCCGVWVALVSFCVYYTFPVYSVNLATILTLALAASFIARKGGYS